MTSDLARWRSALMASLPAGHPVHDPTRAFTYDELDAFEREVERRARGLLRAVARRRAVRVENALQQREALGPASTPPAPVYEDTDFA